MAGKGPPPKDPSARRRSNAPVHEWQVTEGCGWQHGKPPIPPAGMMPASRKAWRIWMGAWFAFNWTPEDLPGLRQVIRLYDQVERGEYQRAGELRLQMDTYGITPKGQQDRRWKPPETGDKERTPRSPEGGGRYGHLRSVPGAG